VGKEMILGAIFFKKRWRIADGYGSREKTQRCDDGGSNTKVTG
jgi:hypothetical protein